MRETADTTNGIPDFFNGKDSVPSFAPGTAPTDNLIAMITNNVVPLEPTLKLADSPSAKLPHPMRQDDEKSPKVQRVIVRD